MSVATIIISFLYFQLHIIYIISSQIANYSTNWEIKLDVQNKEPVNKSHYIPKALGKFLEKYIDFRWKRRNKRKCKNILLNFRLKIEWRKVQRTQAK